MICPFIERTVIQYVLGTDYLGLSSLFSSIISVLSLSELGFSGAVLYNMYKPTAEGDIQQVNALLNYYKRTYRIIGVVVLMIGLCLVPFLPSLVTGTCPSSTNMTVLYLIYLCNSTISFFMFAYMSSIIVVNQRDDINSTRNTIVKIGLTITQIITLLLTRNFYIFVLCMPFFTIVNNLWIAKVVRREFPQYRCEGYISKEQKCHIKKLVAGTFIQRACTVTRNSLDSVCLSAFLGLSVTAVYSNYYQISFAVTGFLGIISTSILGGIGNHVATKSKDDNYYELKQIDFLYMLLSGWCATFLICLYQPFMQMWMGKNMLFPMPTVVLLCIYFYVLKLGDMRYMYMTANGLFWEQRWRSITETFLNLALNIILGRRFGVNGIIVATIISLISCNFFWANIITFNLYFNREKLKDYYLYQLKYAVVTVLVSILAILFCSMLPKMSLIYTLLFRIIICIVIPAIVYFVVYHSLPEYISVKSKMVKK